MICVIVAQCTELYGAKRQAAVTLFYGDLWKRSQGLPNNLPAVTFTCDLKCAKMAISDLRNVSYIFLNIFHYKKLCFVQFEGSREPYNLHY